MKRVLITGASGFVGRHCLPGLVARADEVYAVTRQTRIDWPAGVRVHGVDLHDPQAVARLLASLRPTHLLHLAWNATPGEFWSTPENLDWVASSLRLVRSFAEQGGRRLVIAGTCAEYEASLEPLQETRSACRPGTLYGASKHHLHQLLTTFAAQAGLEFAWARLFGLFGPHEHPRRIVAATLATLLSGRPMQCTSGRQERDILHIRDASDALVTLLDSDVSGPINIASGRAVSIASFVSELAAAVSADAVVEWGTRPLPPGEPPRMVADVTRLRDELHWKPSLTLSEGLRQTAAWWRRAVACHSSTASLSSTTFNAPPGLGSSALTRGSVAGIQTSEACSDDPRWHSTALKSGAAEDALQTASGIMA